MEVNKKGGQPPPLTALVKTLCVCSPISLYGLFSAPHSFTGEDCAEFHVHGGPSVVLALLTALGRIHNCSHAQAGDFTKRSVTTVKQPIANFFQ